SRVLFGHGCNSYAWAGDAVSSYLALEQSARDGLLGFADLFRDIAGACAAPGARREPDPILVEPAVLWRRGMGRSAAPGGAVCSPAGVAVFLAVDGDAPADVLRARGVVDGGIGACQRIWGDGGRNGCGLYSGGVGKG